MLGRARCRDMAGDLAKRDGGAAILWLEDVDGLPGTTFAERLHGAVRGAGVMPWAMLGS